MTDEQSLLAEIERFLARTGMRASTFGFKAVHDGKLVERLRRGGTVTLKTVQAIRRTIAEYDPKAKTRQKKAA